MVTSASGSASLIRRSISAAGMGMRGDLVPANGAARLGESISLLGLAENAVALQFLGRFLADVLKDLFKIDDGGAVRGDLRQPNLIVAAAHASVVEMGDEAGIREIEIVAAG